MKRKFLIVALVIGVALGLSVAVGVAWYFMRTQNDGAADIRGVTSETDPIDVGTGGRGGTTGGNNARAAKFAEHDTDQDGKLGRSLPKRRSGLRRDANHDGFISREEFLPFSAGPKAQ